MAVRITFPGGKTKALTFSYDDGRVFDRRLVGIFNNHGLKGTFHLNSGRMDNPEYYVALEEISTLFKGHEISCHSFSHPFLERIPRIEVLREVWRDREILEKYANYPVTGMSYPMGTSDSAIVEILRSCGIEYCRTTVSTNRFGIPDDLLLWNPTCHHNSMLDLLPGFLNFRYGMAVFYVWGHSYELEQPGKWDAMERFADEVAGKNDIWYVTNIELARYIKAFRALVLSVDGRTAYNPSGVTVWVNAGYGSIPVAPGATAAL